MRVRLEATPEELREKAPLLIETLAKSLTYANPELSAALAKSIEPETVPLRHRALRELKERTDASYKKQMKAMVAEINGVLDGTYVDKSLEPNLTKSEDLTEQSSAPVSSSDPLVTELTTRIDELFRSQAKVEGQLDAMAKSQPAAQSLEGLIHALLLRRGYGERDFDKGGKLDGYSPAELLGIAVARDPVQVIQKAAEVPPPVVNVPAPLVVNEGAQIAPVPDALVKAIERLAAASERDPIVIQKAEPAPVQKAVPLEVTFNRDANGRIVGAVLKPRS